MIQVVPFIRSNQSVESKEQEGKAEKNDPAVISPLVGSKQKKEELTKKRRVDKKKKS
jgi:hypothetical protein